MNKTYNAIMGFVVGDALGVPYEFRKRDTFKAAEMVGYGTHNQPAGTWSDDSSMVLATLTSIERFRKVDPENIMNNFCLWFRRESFTARGKVFDIGGTTLTAIESYIRGESIERCGGVNEMDNGNGALMRVLPLAFVSCTDEEVEKVVALTHNTELSKMFSIAYLDVVKELIDDDCDPIATKHFEAAIKNLNRDEIESGGYVVDTFTAALWCFFNTDNYKDCVLTAVNLGNDTDTVAALAGGLAGLKYGVEDIPKKWINKIPKRDWIKYLCDSVEEERVKK